MFVGSVQRFGIPPRGNITSRSCRVCRYALFLVVKRNSKGTQSHIPFRDLLLCPSSQQKLHPKKGLQSRHMFETTLGPRSLSRPFYLDAGETLSGSQTYFWGIPLNRPVLREIRAGHPKRGLPEVHATAEARLFRGAPLGRPAAVALAGLCRGAALPRRGRFLRSRRRGSFAVGATSLIAGVDLGYIFHFTSDSEQ